MRFYVKQIKPVYYRSSGHGFVEIREPLTDEWFDEREKDELIKIYNPKVEEKDPYGILEFDEKYIPVEVETSLKMKHKYKVIEYEPYCLHLDSLYKLYDNDVKIWGGRCDSLKKLLTNLGIEYEHEVVGRDINNKNRIKRSKISGV